MWDEGSWTVSLLLEYNLDIRFITGGTVFVLPLEFTGSWRFNRRPLNFIMMTSTKSTAYQVLHDLKTGRSGCFQHSYELKAAGSCPKAKRQSWQWQHQLLLCLSFLCLGPSSEYLSLTLCCVEVRSLPLLSLLYPKELGWEREADSSRKHRHRKFDSATVQSVL